MAPRVGLNEEVIAHAAGELADNVGTDNLTLAAVAEHLGVRTPSLYNHINGLAGLRRAVSRLGLRELNRHLERAAMGKSGDDALRAMLDAYRAFAKSRPSVYESTLRAPDPDDELTQSIAKAIVETVLTVLEPYEFNSDEAIHVVRGFRAIGHGFASLEVAGGFKMELDTNESYQRLVSGFIQSIKERCLGT